MENKNYPEWKYRIDISKVKNNFREDWLECFIELHKAVQLLKYKINKDVDSDLIEQIVNWEEDMWFEDKNETFGFGIVKNDDDWEELEYELGNLYDIGDCKKMILFSWGF